MLKEQSKANASIMERLSIDNDRREKKEQRVKLKLCGVTSKVDEALKAPESTLEGLSLHELMCTYHALKKSENWFLK